MPTQPFTSTPPRRQAGPGAGPRIYDGILKLAASLAFGEKPDGRRAVRLYEHLIRRVSDESALIGLGQLLIQGNPQISPNPGRGVQLWEKAIQQHDSHVARFYLAEVLESGVEINGIILLEDDPPRAVRLYTEVVLRAKDTDAMHNLALMLVYGASGVKADAARAVSLLEEAIELNEDADTITSLAVIYERGADGIPQNFQRAEVLYEEAIHRGNCDAMNNLAVLIDRGVVKGDTRRAAALYEHAIATKERKRSAYSNEGYHYHAEAAYNLAQLLEHGSDGIPAEPAKAAVLYARVATDNEDPVAMVSLARLLLRGGRGLSRSPHRALQLIRRAVELGNADARVELARLLEAGDDGVAASPAIAAALYADAAEKGGDNKAAHALARMLTTGASGVPRNAKRAVELLELAVGRGAGENALTSLAELLEDGDAYGEIEVNAPRAVLLYEKAIQKHASIYAMTRLAGMLEEGDGDVSQDRERARTLYRRAIKEGNAPVAAERLEIMEALDGNKENVSHHINALVQNNIDHNNNNSITNEQSQ